MKVSLGNAEAVKIEAVIFDLDGTLIDSEPAAALAVQKCFADWKVQLEDKDATFVTGRTWENAFNYLFKKYPVPIAINEAKAKIMDSYRIQLENHLVVVPGSVRAVESLAGHYPLALVSGSGRSEIFWALKKLNIENRFRIILGAEDYPHSKPHPDCYLKATELLKSSPRSCLVFEDSTAGIASAIAAGLWVVAITGTNHFQQDTSKAHCKISDLSEISPEWIENLSVRLN